MVPDFQIELYKIVFQKILHRAKSLMLCRDENDRKKKRNVSKVKRYGNSDMMFVETAFEAFKINPRSAPHV